MNSHWNSKHMRRENELAYERQRRHIAVANAYFFSLLIVAKDLLMTSYVTILLSGKKISIVNSPEEKEKMFAKFC